MMRYEGLEGWWEGQMGIRRGERVQGGGEGGVWFEGKIA